MLSIGDLLGVFEILTQHGAIIGVCTILNQELCSLTRGFPAQIGNTLLCYNNLYIMFGVVDMRYHRYDARNEPALSC